jgi:hypothetical protein
VQHVAPRTLPVFLAANSVATLSGVRAYDAYHEFYGFNAQAEEQAAADVLERHGVYLLPSGHEAMGADGGRLMFELLNYGGLESLAGNYKLPDGEKWPIVKANAYTPEGFVAWSTAVESWLTALVDDGSLPLEWKEVPLMTHELRFGMLLGYPGKVLESNLWLELLSEKNDGQLPDSEQTMLARIEHDSEYYAARQTYTIPTELRHDPEIKAHERLWSEVLGIVYDSEWHQQLRANADFIELMRMVEKIEADERAGIFL